MDYTITNSSGKTMYRVVYNGVMIGYMTAKARREFCARKGITVLELVTNGFGR